MKDRLNGRLALALALALPGAALAQDGGRTYEVTGGRPTKASDTGRSGQASSWRSSVDADVWRDAPADTPAATATKAQETELQETKSPRRWWQFWRWFESDAPETATEVR